MSEAVAVESVGARVERCVLEAAVWVPEWKGVWWRLLCCILWVQGSGGVCQRLQQWSLWVLESRGMWWRQLCCILWVRGSGGVCQRLLCCSLWVLESGGVCQRL